MRKLFIAIMLVWSVSIAYADDKADCKSALDIDKSIAACTHLIDIHSSTVATDEAYAFRGIANYRKNLFDAAISDFSQILKGSEVKSLDRLTSAPSDTPNAWLWRGMSFVKTGRYPEALRDFDQFISQQERRPEGHFGRGLALEAMGHAELAIASYRRTLEQIPTSQYYETTPEWLSAADKIDGEDVKRRIAALEVQVSKAATDNTDRHAATDLLVGNLYGGKTREAERLLLQYTASQPAEQQGFLALGTAQFVLAVEHLGRSLFRYGLEGRKGDIFGLELPFLRFPVPPNPDPEKFTYKKAQEVLKTFIADLAVADASLSKVSDQNVALPINVGLVRLDLDGDGKAADHEALWLVFARVSSLRIEENQAKQFLLRLDAGDVAWMRGYGHLMSAMSEFLLAYDWHDDFDHTFHRFFPRAQLPHSSLDDLLNRQWPLWDEYYKCHKTELTDCWSLRPADANALIVPEFVEIADLLAFIHLMHWPVAEPARMENVLHHLEAMVEMSRLSWKLILAETDDDHEWIPNPKQLGMLPGMRINQQIIDGWLGFMDQFDGLLKGKVLLGHWRLAKGINLRRVFLEPTTFDPILWVQGSAATPYLEDGTMAQGDTWQRLQRVFGGDFFRYAIWLN